MSDSVVSTRVVTGLNTRFSYLHVFEPKSINGDKPRYSVCLLIPKSDQDTVGKIRAGIQAAYQDGAAKLRGGGKTVPPLETIWYSFFRLLSKAFTINGQLKPVFIGVL